MLGPSPDWIVGASALEMCLANCTWLDNKVPNKAQCCIDTSASKSCIRIASEVAKVNGLPREEKNFYRQFSIAKYSSLPTDTFRKYVEMHVTCRKLALKFTGYCRQTSYTDSEVVFTLLPAVA